MSAAVAVVAMASGRMAADATTENIHLVVTGGAFAGTYDATSTAGGCSTGANGPGSWGNSLISKGVTDPKVLASFPLIVPSAKAAASGTKEFFLGVGFGPLMQRMSNPYQLEIETRPDQKKPTGSGLVTVKDNGTTAVVTITGKTADGASIEAKIDCRTVVRMPS
jgi:hypothetical protein